jgi:hypothetical protein
MTQLSHNYSKHTVEELGNETLNLDPKVHPERAKALQLELNQRLLAAQAAAARAALAEQAAAARVISEQALVVGARFDQLDPPAQWRFLWPYLGISVVVAVVYGVLTAIGASVIAGLIVGFSGLNISALSRVTTIVQFVLGIVLMVPITRWWLRRITKWNFGGYHLRIVSKSE